jgi:hypothetical protein
LADRPFEEPHRRAEAVEHGRKVGGVERIEAAGVTDEDPLDDRCR